MRSITRVLASLFALAILAPPVFAEESDPSSDSGRGASTTSEAGMPSESTAGTGGAGGDLLPPNGKAGQCYARVYTPPVYKTKHEQALKRAESESVSIIPAKFETVEETVLVQEASKRIEVIPAAYEWVTEQVLIKLATTLLNQVPDTYETDLGHQIICRVEIILELWGLTHMNHWRRT